MLCYDGCLDTAPDIEFGRDAHEARSTGLHQILENAICHRFMEGTFLPVRPDVELKRPELDAALVRYVLDVQRSKVGLSCLRTEAGEFGNPNPDRIIPWRHRIIEYFELL